MKGTYLFILLVYTVSVFSQKEQGSITYEMFLDLNDWKTNGEQSPEMRQLMKDVELVSFTLLYNSEGMIFMDNRSDAEIEKMIFGIRPGFRYYYKKAAIDSLFSVEKMDHAESIITKMQYHTDWELTQETKKINGFVCYKATRMPSPDSIEVPDKSSPIVAWYTLEIPLPYGPFTYGSLPGLILEIQREEIVYFKAKTMRWDDNNKVKIVFPK